MKKLKLKALELGANEVLTRAQLKNVLGGVNPITTTTGGRCLIRCFDDSVCTDPNNPSCSFTGCNFDYTTLYCGPAPQ